MDPALVLPVPVRRVPAPLESKHGSVPVKRGTPQKARGDSVDGRWRQAAASVDGYQHATGRPGRSGQRQQRSSYSAEAETDGRQDSPGDRRGALPDGEGHLRHLPRLRRADCAGPAQRDSVDARLHHLQGKTKLVKSTEMLQLLTEFHRDKAAMRQRHAAAAEFVADYDFNNTYQYVIAREDMHLRWLADAITDLGGSEAAALPPAQLNTAGKPAEVQRSVMTDDRDAARDFIDKWRGRLGTLPNARHRTLLNV